MTPLERRTTEAETILAATILQRDRDSRTRGLRHICLEAVDIAKACYFAEMAALPTGALVLERALFERLLVALWIARSDENAARFADAAKQETARQLRKFIDSGVGVLVRKSTGEDVTAELRKDPRFSEIKRFPSFEVMAKEVGIEDIYVKQYGFMSMFSHGNTYDLFDKPTEMLKMARNSAAAELRAIMAILTAWYELMSQLTRDDLREYLKL